MTDVEADQRVAEVEEEVNPDPLSDDFNMDQPEDINLNFQTRGEENPLKKSVDEEIYFTFDEALDKVGFGIFQIILMFICGSGWMFDGIELLLISFILPELTAHWELSPIQSGLCGSAVFFGMMIGAALGGIVSDFLGRKIIFVGAITITTIFGFASAFSPGYIYFLIFRCCAGIGLGASVPTDISLFIEFCPTKYRGLSVILMNLYWGFGAAFISIVAFFVMPAQVTGNHSWRFLVGIGALPGIFIIFARLFVPESPRYFMVSKKIHKVYEILRIISIWNRVELPKGKLIYYSPKQKPPFVQTLFGLFSKQLMLTTLLLWVMWFCLSLGSWGFGFIIPIIFERLNKGRSKQYIYVDTLITLITGTLGYVLLAVAVNKVGRKILMGIFFLISGLLTFSTGLYSSTIYVLVFSAAVNFTSTSPWGVIFAYTPEVYPTTLRTTAMGTCAFFTRVAGTITPLFGESLLSYGIEYPMILYGASLMIAGVCSFLLPIETLGRELQDEISDDSGLSVEQLNAKKNNYAYKEHQKSSIQPLIEKDQ